MTTWNPRNPEESRHHAEAGAGSSELGYMYRLEDRSYSYTVDPETETYGTYTIIHLSAFPIIRKTPKGHRIKIPFSSPKFVLDEATKRFACTTIGLALESFIARKDKQARIYESRAKKARALIEEAKGNTFYD